MLSKIMDYIFGDGLTKMSKQEQLAFISSINPRDDFERSYAQYKCQMKKAKKMFMPLINLVSLLLLINNRFFHRNSTIEKAHKKNVCLFVHEAVNVPKEYRTDYILLEDISGQYMDGYTKEFCKELKKRYFWNFYFRAKLEKKLLFYNYLINKYNPENIVTANEYSFSSSILTYYLSYYKIKHIDVMHGEKIFDINDAFFHFDKNYVWDEYYIKQFQQLKAQIDDVEIYLPKERFVINKNPAPAYFMTVYLQNQSEQEMSVLKEKLDLLNNRAISIRPHPRYTNYEAMKTVFAGYEIEDTSKVTCEQSIAKTENILTVYSTVALQGYFSGINVVFDDISSPSTYNLLKDLEYYLLDKYGTLTEFILRQNNEGKQ